MARKTRSDKGKKRGSYNIKKAVNKMKMRKFLKQKAKRSK